MSNVPASGRFLLIALASGQPWRFAYNLPRKMAPNPIDQHVGRRVWMRPLVLPMSPAKPGAALRLTHQHVQKHDECTPPTVASPLQDIDASRLQQISHILQVPITFFFEGAPNASAPHGSNESELWMAQIDDFVSDPDGFG